MAVSRSAVAGLVGMTAALAIALVIFAVYAFGALRSRPEPVDVGWDQPLDPALGAIRIRGMAHYGAMVTLNDHTLVEGERTWYVYGLFPPHDTESREIRLLVRSRVRPEDMIGFEYVEVEGWLYLPDKYSVPLFTEQYFQRNTSYYFADGMLVVQPWRITSYEPGLDDVPADGVDPGVPASVPDPGAG